jgi:hypothetical protein
VGYLLRVNAPGLNHELSNGGKKSSLEYGHEWLKPGARQSKKLATFQTAEVSPIKASGF